VENNFNSIERNPDKCFSRPSIKGRRLSVYDVISGVGNEGVAYCIDMEVTKTELDESIQYCMNLYCLYNSQNKFCNGCFLNKIFGDFDEDDINKGWLIANELSRNQPLQFSTIPPPPSSQ
jgi:hypothetical protein